MSEGTIARQAIAHRGRHLEYFTIAWNTLEGLIGVGAGLFAGSISLVGFGMDSFIEVTSGATLLWRMSVDKDVERRIAFPESLWPVSPSSSCQFCHAPRRRLATRWGAQP